MTNKGHYVRHGFVQTWGEPPDFGVPAGLSASLTMELSAADPNLILKIKDGNGQAPQSPSYFHDSPMRSLHICWAFQLAMFDYNMINMLVQGTYLGFPAGNPSQ